MKHGISIQGRVSGQYYIERDVQKRLYTSDGTIGWNGGNETTSFGMGGWVVFQQGDGSAIGDTIQLGLFWTKQHAEIFLDSIKKSKGDV